MRAELIGHFKACITEIYLHIDARMADYIRMHPYACGACVLVSLRVLLACVLTFLEQTLPDLPLPNPCPCATSPKVVSCTWSHIKALKQACAHPAHQVMRAYQW